MKMIELNTFSHSGKDKANEDYALCHRLSDNSLVAVLADGMGGLSYGAEAAKSYPNLSWPQFAIMFRNVRRKKYYGWHLMQPMLPYTGNAGN